MTEQDWEGRQRARLERSVASVVNRLRRLADQVEREAKYNVAAAAGRERDYATYGRVAQQLIHEVTWGVANCNLGNVIDAAIDADRAVAEKNRGQTDA